MNRRIWDLDSYSCSEAYPSIDLGITDFYTIIEKCNFHISFGLPNTITYGGILSFCSEPETVCTVFRPCCGRDWVCNRKSSATGKCVQCAQANSPCIHANDCCRGACIKGSCKLMSFFGEE
ncbi:unnamed protein product [Schistosoma mattheei]|uniref:Uncharacterized protein n=1 Tax=Schistosoma mattheei TaxID=31246 RepID=A0A183P1P5_9TREM|nr:unnamed protein product [Schistosoma mattheei]